MKRWVVADAGAAVLTVAVARPAAAHDCTNASKPAGAGSVGTVDGGDGSFTPSGQRGRGFVTITDGTEAGTAEVFLHTSLPNGARNAGPEDNMCDGIGIDDGRAASPGGRSSNEKRTRMPSQCRSRHAGTRLLRRA